jgi:hypothetical protein
MFGTKTCCCTFGRFHFALVNNYFHPKMQQQGLKVMKVGGDANGIFHGFTFVLWLVILMKAFYGQVVGLVFKYADNILKVYASSMSVIVSAVLCWMFLGIPLTGSSIVAGVLVIIATMLYYNYKNLMMTDTETCSACMSMLPCGSSSSRLPQSYAPVEQNDKKDDDSNAGQA